MQCGLSPLRAIKEGDVYLGYDTKFIYGEVNGNIITWVVDKDFNVTPGQVNTHGVIFSIPSL